VAHKLFYTCFLKQKSAYVAAVADSRSAVCLNENKYLHVNIDCVMWGGLPDDRQLPDHKGSTFIKVFIH